MVPPDRSVRARCRAESSELQRARCLPPSARKARVNDLQARALCSKNFKKL
jgi:hypothetical protein